jgi:hypothetical protein
MSKGSTQRPTNKTSFEANYDAIWGNKSPKEESKQKPPTKNTTVPTNS